jgi:hypothetical protein
MNIKIEDITLSSWAGYPFWFHIGKGDKEISFTHKEVYGVRDALSLLIREYEENNKERQC